MLLAINAYVFYSVFNVSKQVYDKKKEKVKTSTKLVNLQEEEEALKVQVNKLEENSSYLQNMQEKSFFLKKENILFKRSIIT